MAHRYWRIEQRHQQVLLDVPNAGIALSQAGADVFEAKAIHLPHPLLHKYCRVIMAANADGLCFVAKGFDNQANQFIQQLLIHALLQYVIANLLPDLLSYLFHLVLLLLIGWIRWIGWICHLRYE